MTSKDFAMVWKELRTILPSLNDKELRACIVRCHHYASCEVKELRNTESFVWEWLRSRSIDAHCLMAWLNKKYPTSYSKTYREKRLEKRFRQVIELKQSLRTLLPTKSDEDLRRMINRVMRHGYGRIHKLTDEEHLLKDYLLKNSLNVANVSSWFVQATLPEDVQSQLFSGRIKRATAVRMSENRERQLKVSIGWQIIEAGRQLILEVM